MTPMKKVTMLLKIIILFMSCSLLSALQKLKIHQFSAVANKKHMEKFTVADEVAYVWGPSFGSRHNSEVSSNALTFRRWISTEESDKKKC